MGNLTTDDFNQLLDKSIRKIRINEILTKRREHEQAAKIANSIFMELLNYSRVCNHKYIVKLDENYYCVDCLGIVGEHLLNDNMLILEATRNENESDLDVLERIVNNINELMDSDLHLTEEDAFRLLINKNKIKKTTIKRRVLK